jgi:molybdopterin converting factor small subunit
MKYNTLTIKKLSLVLMATSFIFVGCGGGDDIETTETNDTEKADSAKTTLLTVNGEIFSIPSPIQTAILIKQVGANYDKAILNDPKNYSNYSTKFQKALNLGVYGADLGYVTMYEQTQDAIGYLASVRKLADELGVSGAFDLSLVDRFEKNMGNRDTILALVSDAYRASDSYLKNNERDDLGALVLAGGWAESIYFATNVAKVSKSEEVIKRIGEQKKTVENLIKMLSPYYNNAEFTAFIDSLIDLAGDFDNIKFIYIYEKPTTDVENKVTTINSRTEVSITEDQLKTISDKIAKIRKSIVG